MAAAGLPALKAQAGRLARLWLAEARAVAPERWAAWAEAGSRPRLLLTLDEGRIRARLERPAMAAEWSAASFLPAVLDAWLKSGGLDRKAVMLVAELPPALFFSRALSVPRAALPALRDIARQEILHRTPFDPAEIFHGVAQLAPTARGEVVQLRQDIIRRDILASALAPFGLAPDDIDAVRCDFGGIATTISLRDDAAAAAAARPALLRNAALATLALTLCGLALVWFAEHRATATIEDEIAALREGQANASGGEGAARLFMLRTGPSALQVWEELSRVLPDHTYLTGMRFADGRIVVTGFSSDAAHLVRQVDASPLFSNASLTGPITADAAEQKDRFSLAFQLRGVRPSTPHRATAVAQGAP